MFQFLLSILLVCIGTFLVFSTDVEEKQKPVAKQDKTGKADKAERSSYLRELKVPANFPSVLKLFFGSQSGTAERFCQTLEEEAAQIGVFDKIKVVNFEDFDPSTFGKGQDELTLVCAATHYEGEPCDNTAKFHAWVKQLKKAGERSAFKSMQFAIFGLGDTSYEKFNAVGKLYDQLFSDLGAARVAPMGEGNSEHQQTEEQFEEWKSQIWDRIAAYFEDRNPNKGEVKAKKGMAAAKVSPDGMPLHLKFVSSSAAGEGPVYEYDMAARQYQVSQRVPISEVNQLRQDTKEGSTLELFFDLKFSSLRYKTAQNLAMFPENSEGDVRRMLHHLGVSLAESQKLIAFELVDPAKKTKHPFKTPCLIYEAIEKFIDLRGALTKKVLKTYAAYCSDPQEKARMEEIAASKDLMASEITGPRIGLLDLLTTRFPSCKPTLSQLLQTAPKIMPRYYTIASSSLKHPEQIRIAISLTKDSAGTDKEWYGFNSQFLNTFALRKKADPSAQLACNVFVKDSMFAFPSSESNAPLLMIGPGTGVVPFIGYIEDRQIEAAPEGRKAHLLFGCRRPTTDFIFKDILEAAAEKMQISSLDVAFSRIEEVDPSAKNAYVQDILASKKDQLLPLIQEQKASIFICGNTKMGQDVQTVLKEWVGADGLKAIEKEGRLTKELWAN